MDDTVPDIRKLSVGRFSLFTSNKVSDVKYFGGGSVAWWLERWTGSRVRLPAAALPSSDPGQVVHACPAPLKLRPHDAIVRVLRRDILETVLVSYDQDMIDINRLVLVLRLLFLGRHSKTDMRISTHQPIFFSSCDSIGYF